MCHQVPSEFTAGITDYKQHVNILQMNAYHLLARVKNHWKEINTWATIRSNTVFVYEHRITVLLFIITNLDSSCKQT